MTYSNLISIENIFQGWEEFKKGKRKKLDVQVFERDLEDNLFILHEKLKNKIYYHHTGYPGGLRSIKADKLMDKKPTEVLRKAISGMLPKNKMHKVRMSNLFIYEGTEHPHNAQISANAKS